MKFFTLNFTFFPLQAVFLKLKLRFDGFFTMNPMIIIVYGSILPPFPNNWAAIVG
jgi:hypothetical protein